ncbi:MAG: hypothetical protein WD557_16775 [Dehalococcoidia bacterium]
MRLLRAVPATVYVAALSIAIAYGSPALYPGGDREGGAQRSFATPSLTPGDVQYHFDPADPSQIGAVSFALSGDSGAVSATLAGHSLSCRRLADARWYCPATASIPVARVTTLRVSTQRASTQRVSTQ